MQEEIHNIKNEAMAQIMESKTRKDLEEIRIRYLGRNGLLTKLTKDMSRIPEVNRKMVGITLNEVKINIQEIIEEKINDVKIDKSKIIDPTIPGIKPQIGSLHLVTQAIEEISEVFKRIGFTRVRYPEIEWDWYSFTALNFDKWHPARDDWETFFIDENDHTKYGKMLLTPHTSSGQIREMERNKPPIRMINISKCYRRQSDVSHTQMFHQFEGLVVDENISIANLRGTIDYFFKNYFGPNRELRLRPYNFPFTEPSFEVDISCDLCNGKGCKLCKEGWLELAGAGMVHPNVLKNCGIDSEKYSGFAFGWGVERVSMMKSGLSIPDLRLLYNSDLRFLKQF